MAKVFVSWSGEAGRRVAELLADKLLACPGLQPWVSSQDIAPGDQWQRTMEEALASSDYGIACITPTTSLSPWINFESGFIFGKLRTLFVLTVGELLPAQHPLRMLQTVDGHDKAGLVRLLERLTSLSSFSSQWVEAQFPVWRKGCDEILGESHELMSISSALQSIQHAARHLEGNAGLFANPLFRSVVKRSLDEIAGQLNGVVTSYEVPADRYPAYLASLQRSLRTTITAVALVEHEEFFWRGQLGKQVLETTTTKDSERVFVLQSSHHCVDFMPTLLEHARRYQVYVLPLAVFAKELPQYLSDFSIIEVAGNRMLGTYVDHGRYFRNIQFSVDPTTIREHQEAFDIIRSLATRVESRTYSEQDIHEVWVRSERSVSELERKPVEMSRYTPIHAYEEHEERHAYYRDMMDEMIRRLPAGEALRVLEVGAGTGIFTRRLATLDRVKEIVAIEYDWACCERLRHNMLAYPKVIVEFKDSRVFNPEGEFDVIVSSFADHHIRSVDKSRYFDNVIRNLRPDANFIVGDEFLPEHDMADERARIAALERYHGHIIAIAESQGELVLADLERRSLKSGIDRYGDFKVTCPVYEEMLARAGFEFSRHLIGPVDRSDLGGVFVYDARRRDGRAS